MQVLLLLALLDVGVGAAGRYVTINDMLTCGRWCWPIDRGGSNCEYRVYHLLPVNRCCVLYVLALKVA